MPLSEILDRYTITKLKSERTNEDVSEELKTYKAVILTKICSTEQNCYYFGIK